MTTTLLPVHPERTADAATLVWRFGGGLGHGPADGWSDDVDAAFAELVADQVVTEVRAEDDAVRVTLAPDHRWHAEARAVRAAVQRAAARRAGASTQGGAETPADPAARRAALEVVVREALDDVVGPYAAGHGGGVQLLEVSADTVRVRLVGACHGCPAAGLTVHARLEALIRNRAPWLAGVEVASSPQPSGWLHRRS